MAVIRVDRIRPDPETIARAAEILRRGGLVAFPTETVYGLGANALDQAAVGRIFAAKGRPSFNPLIAHVPDVDAARRLVTAWPDTAERLAEVFWPGPLTLVLPKQSGVPDVVTAGMPTVAVRVPAHPVAHALLVATGLPLAAPSANRYTGISPTTADHVEKALGHRVDLILDAGPTDVGIESTVVDLSGEHPLLLRPGSLSPSRLEDVIGALARPAPIAEPTAARASPGMVSRHYAPRARVHLFATRRRAAAEAAEEAEAAAEEAIASAHAAGLRIGALTRGAALAAVHHPVRMPDEPEEYARRLYAVLHELDADGCDLILIERVPDTPEWAGVRDRLERSAHPA